VVKEIGSGANDTRPQLRKLLIDPTITLIVVEHQDRLTRFGFNSIEQLLAILYQHCDQLLRPVVRAEPLGTKDRTHSCGVAKW
jgi:predicted site-specific integrase-resolvase